MTSCRRLSWESDNFAFVITLSFFARQFETDELLIACTEALAGEASVAEAAAVFKNVRRSNAKTLSYDRLRLVELALEELEAALGGGNRVDLAGDVRGTAEAVS